MTQDWRLYAFASALFAALTAILAKVGVAGVNSNFATLFRTAVVLVLSGVLVWQLKAWQSPASLPPRSLLFLTLSGLATGASWLCYYHALKLGPASKVAVIDKCSVLLVVMFAALFLGEPFGWRVLIGALLILAGIVTLSG
jgi:bacterial/archaeal transporter family protein